MRKILIVGAGQSGLQLAHGLLSHDYDVTLITGQSSTEIRTGRPSITQLTYPTVLGYERELNLDFWGADPPQIEKVKLHGYPPGLTTPMVEAVGSFGDGLYGVSVDRRIKMADWLEYFEDRGGKVVINGVTVGDLDYFTRMFDLVIVAVGHGELGAMFDTDPDRFGEPRRRLLAQAHVYDAEPDPAEGDAIAWGGITGDAGSVNLLPTLTAQGPCHSVFIVEREGGVIGNWPDKLSSEEQWQHMLAVIKDYAPEYYERLHSASLVDGRSATRETMDLQVRKAVGTLPSGGKVLGIADVVISSDPFANQGWNHSGRCAHSYLDSILQRGDQPFDTPYLEGMFERYWQEYGRAAEIWADTCASIWDRELPPHFVEIFSAAAIYPEVADRWIKGWDYPPDYENWVYDPELTRQYLAEVAARHS